jgi:hypothetical protein
MFHCRGHENAPLERIIGSFYHPLILKGHSPQIHFNVILISFTVFHMTALEMFPNENSLEVSGFLILHGVIFDKTVNFAEFNSEPRDI